MPTAALTYRNWVARSIARALLADAEQPGARVPHALQARAAAVLGERPAWLVELVGALGPPDPWRHDVDALAARIEAEHAFGTAFADGAVPHVRRLILRPPLLGRLPLGLESLDRPPLTGAADLAHWLGLGTDRLLWLGADKGHWRRPEDPRLAPTQHYRQRLAPKPRGGLRLLEIPKAELKRVQRRLLDGLLAPVPVHEAAHGYVAGRSAVTHAASHTGQAVLLRFDLQDFFNSITAARIHALWRTLGYPAGIARLLTTLCTTRTPAAVRERLQDDGGFDRLAAMRLAERHLPQGAPTSPALANLCCFRLDLRLAGLAERFDAHYTRYADDLAFSGPATLRGDAKALGARVGAIAQAEGFRLQARKTACVPRHRRQLVTGIVVNDKPNLPRDAFDRLKAQLHRCATRGVRPDDDAAALRGQVGWVAQLNPARAAKLQAWYDRIDWTRTATGG
jgi:RNA-directed DNA polymerase